jgi:chromosome segregation ATPase
LIDSIAHYLNVINKEKMTFDNEMSSAEATMVGEKEKEIENLSLQAQQKTEQIQRLTAEIQGISENISTLKSEAAQAKISIAQKQADFNVTVQQLEGQILDYKTKISQHIQ